MRRASIKGGKAMKTIQTNWSACTYYVWGNAKDGYEVNNRASQWDVELTLQVRTANAGTPHEFKHAYPSASQIGRVFGTRAALDLDGDDRIVYVNRRRDGYPIGELVLTSHDRLSPIKETR